MCHVKHVHGSDDIFCLIFFLMFDIFAYFFGMCHVECLVTDVPMRICHFKHVHESDDIFGIFLINI